MNGSAGGTAEEDLSSSAATSTAPVSSLLSSSLPVSTASGTTASAGSGVSLAARVGSTRIDPQDVIQDLLQGTNINCRESDESKFWCSGFTLGFQAEKWKLITQLAQFVGCAGVVHVFFDTFSKPHWDPELKRMETVFCLFYLVFIEVIYFILTQKDNFWSELPMNDDKFQTTWLLFCSIFVLPTSSFSFIRLLLSSLVHFFLICHRSWYDNVSISYTVIVLYLVYF